MEAERPFERLTRDDLARLSTVARNVLDQKVSRTPVGGRYKERLVMLVLCQGWALHYVDGKNGIKDLDVWAFFRAGLPKPFPWRSIWRADFGLSHLGHDPAEQGYSGRRIDVIGRSIITGPDTDDAEAIRRWLHHGRGSAMHLVKRPVIGIFPEEYLGKLIWCPSI
jgi:hypothetical protein